MSGGYSEAHGAIGLALWYPVLVLSLAYGLFVGLVYFVAPRLVAAFDALGLAVIEPLRWFEWIGNSARYWWPVGPIAIVLLLVVWVNSGTTGALHARLWSALRLFPWMRSLLADYEAANFSELLALLLEHQVPYHSALVLAAESSGDARLVRGARAVAEALERGERPATRWRPSAVMHSFPCCAGSWQPARPRVLWSRPCTTWQPCTASGPGSRPRSCPCSCPCSC